MGKKPSENIMGKGEMLVTGSYQDIHLFLQYFLPYQKKITPYLVALKLLSANALNFDNGKILLSGKSLSYTHP